MKQLLLRVPEELHERLAARARRERRSVNSLATELIEMTVGAGGPSDRRARLRAKAAALGILRPAPRPEKRLTAAERQAAIDSTRGLGPMADRLIDEDRGRLDHLR
jgi:hypothetical protein